MLQMILQHFCVILANVDCFHHIFYVSSVKNQIFY